MLPHPATGLSQDPDEYILWCSNCGSFSHRERRWYDINTYGGRLFDRWSWLMVIAGALGFFVPAGFFLPISRSRSVFAYESSVFSRLDDPVGESKPINLHRRFPVHFARLEQPETLKRQKQTRLRFFRDLQRNIPKVHRSTNIACG
jgi:hypothetical protein